MRLRAAFAILAVTTVASSACTQDFGEFEPGPGEGTPSSSGDPVVDGGTCADKAACFSTGRTCRDGCGTTFTSCQTACPPGQPGEDCKKECEDDRKDCEDDCSSTCESCAGASCDGDCP